MIDRWKWIAAAAGAVVLILASAWAFAAIKTRGLEREVESARIAAETSERRAAEVEGAAGGYRQKLEYLETELAAIRAIARRQDEELEKIGVDVGGARRDVARARGVRAIEGSVEELCAKLDELGHPCR